jgi:hypothetical protein
MTADRARELLQVQANFGGFYNRNSAWLILAEVHTVGAPNLPEWGVHQRR